MKRVPLLLMATGICVFSLFSTAVFAGAEAMTHQASGEVAAIDLDFNTVVVEAPMGGRMFTVGGPLAPDAILTKGGVSVDLEDFQKGDRVNVRWKTTNTGHRIVEMTSE